MFAGMFVRQCLEQAQQFGIAVPCNAEHLPTVTDIGQHNSPFVCLHGKDAREVKALAGGKGVNKYSRNVVGKQ